MIPDGQRIDALDQNGPHYSIRLKSGRTITLGLDNEGLGKADPPAEEIGPGSILHRVSGMKISSLPVGERREQNLTGAPPVKGTRLAEHLPLHEPDVGTAQNQDDPLAALPTMIPKLLEDPGKARARLRNPLKLVERENQFRSARKHPGDFVKLGLVKLRLVEAGLVSTRHRSGANIAGRSVGGP